ncbi:hypothetical protein PMZ80_004235 [Knufia obscura]|uniref:Uncharacterized protein n=1 Tax=Knufia obscura TaxID=1635080 RepID=A0ABR0RRP5_9EURO|nr:hypothetical protein PMZ80_004235 [Knufia obscura]
MKTRESIDNAVKLHDDDPFGIARMIQFFYTNSLDLDLGAILVDMLDEASAEPDMIMPPRMPDTGTFRIAYLMCLLADRHHISALRKHTFEHVLNDLDFAVPHSFQPFDANTYSMLVKYGHELLDLYNQLIDKLSALCVAASGRGDGHLRKVCDDIMVGDGNFAVACM